MNKDIRYYCDGSGFNGKVCKICTAKSFLDYEIQSFGQYFTNNELEYLAVYDVLYKFKDSLGDRKLIIYTDSQLVVSQVVGHPETGKLWEVNKLHLKVLVNNLKDLIKNTGNVELKWIPREKNIAGIILDAIKNINKKLEKYNVELA